MMEYEFWTDDQLKDEFERLVEAEIQSKETLRTLNEYLKEVKKVLIRRGYRV